jgi:hypothetical protein
VGGGERGRSGKALCEEEGREKKKKYSLYEGICFFLSLTIGNLFCYLTFATKIADAAYSIHVMRYG